MKILFKYLLKTKNFYYKMLSTDTHYRNKPFLVICGCTGTGKTKLSIELAKWLNDIGQKAEIVNADAMQVKFNF
jgi:signal recognition particle GTPase